MFDLHILISLILFFMGALGVVLRKNIFIVLMSIELMLNATALLFAQFARQNLNMDGQVIVLLIIAIAASEASFGLGLIVLLYKKKSSLNINIFNELRDEDVS